MERMVLGRTGLEAYRLALGGIPIQRVSEAEAVETVRHAVERGVDFIDTSRAYTSSERRIGLALKRTDKRVIVASKSMSQKAEGARADLETSLRELQLDRIDIYQCHFVGNDAAYQTVVSPGGALEGLRKARDEGLVGHIGITSHSLSVLDRALDDGLFDTIMVCFSFLEPKAREEIIPKALAKNIGVLAMKPFSGGVIEDARLALKYSLSEPGVLVLAGVEHPRSLRRELAGVRGGRTSDRVRERGDRRASAALRQGLLPPLRLLSAMSEEIPIQTVLGVRNLVKRMGSETFNAGPFAKVVAKGRDCTGCGTCLPRCPYELPIPDLIRESLDWLDEQ